MSQLISKQMVLKMNDDEIKVINSLQNITAYMK